MRTKAGLVVAAAALLSLTPGIATQAAEPVTDSTTGGDSTAECVDVGVTDAGTSTTSTTSTTTTTATTSVSTTEPAAPTPDGCDDDGATAPAPTSTAGADSTDAPPIVAPTTVAPTIGGPAQVDGTTRRAMPSATTTDPETPATEPTLATTIGTPVGTTIAPLVVAGPATPSRGTQLQLTPPPPPPSTTTLPPIPPEWIVPPNSGAGRRVVYSKTMQRVWVVDGNERMIKTHLVSGKRTPLDPRPGTYRVWSRSRHTFAIQNPSITWGYMIRFAKGANGGNIGFHEIPYQYGRPVQSISQLGQALSGGCVRQARSDAIWMWNWAGIGTVVVVLP